MTITLNEFKELHNYMNEGNYEDFICDVQENSRDYECILEEITTDIKHIISEYLNNAIQCGFDEEIMRDDFDIPEEFIGILSHYKYNKIDFKLRDYNILQNK